MIKLHPRIIFLGFLVIIFFMGSYSTHYIFQQYDVSFLGLIQNLKNGYFLLIPILTLFNLTLRFFRWNFLLRTYFIYIPSRELLSYYFTSYIGNLTPFYFLYLLRLIPIFKSKQFRGIFVFFLDLSLDFIVILLFYFFYKFYLTIFLFFLFTSVISFALHYYFRYQHLYRDVFFVSGIFFALSYTVMIWFLTSWVFPLAIGSFNLEFPIDISLYSLSIMNLGNLLAIFPTGVYISSEKLIEFLLQTPIPKDITIYSVFLIKISTSWVAIGTAFLFLIFFRKQLFSKETHFDQIAEEYEEQIPQHIKERVLKKKIDIITNSVPKNAKGLDAGCGQGWYVKEMMNIGYQMYGIDFSEKQLQKAKELTKNPNLFHGSITELPFPDEYFDFIYTINVLHHLPTKEEQIKALNEFYRVLKPKGKLIIHEINVLNPFFRFYISYIFPLIKSIDEGTEIWIDISLLKNFSALSMFSIIKIEYFTFLPDFLPKFLLKIFEPIEAFLETSSLRKFSAHISFIMEKT
ncbi:MAG: methyltransferase domain-containing protein [Leptospiraceae bacterium]|nr:methyltransferase domain-containing protein [Leptospiraceae bacterium]MDW7975575.1 methyltransferase domain-containing protein [Leptospiraceae bacterium]